MATANAMVEMITIFWNFGVTRMLKNLYAARVTPAAAKVPSTACTTMPEYRYSKYLLIMPMNTPSIAAYTSTRAGLTTRRNATSSTTTEADQTREDQGREHQGVRDRVQASAAVTTSTAMVTAVLVTTSSKVIRPSGAWTGAWPGYCA